jgi:hypothetical protein
MLQPAAWEASRRPRLGGGGVNLEGSAQQKISLFMHMGSSQLRRVPLSALLPLLE